MIGAPVSIENLIVSVVSFLPAFALMVKVYSPSEVMVVPLSKGLSFKSRVISVCHRQLLLLA